LPFNKVVINLDVAGNYIEGTPLSNPIPEPTTILLLGSGLVGLAGFRKKSTKRS